MAFKFPLPILKKKKCESTQLIQPISITGLVDFKKSDFTSSELIGKGSYGKIYKIRRNEKEYVVKELASEDATDHEKNLFVKEAKLMASVKGHPNILEIHGYSTSDNSLLLEFMSFSFEKLQLTNDAVSNLKDLLKACDRISDFQGFENMSYHLALDVLSGLDYLHEKGIVHRDLKPDNILVSNQHYAGRNDEELQYWWRNKPVVAKLTDFGESRSLLVQTRTLCNTSTINLVRGSPVYMAPEAILENATNVGIDALKRMDIWSVGMVLFHVLNPDAKYPYAEEVNELKASTPMAAVKGLLRNKTGPSNLPKHEHNRKCVWNGIVQVCSACLDFDAATRPTCRELLSILLRTHVCINSLLVSQGSITEATDERLVGGVRAYNASDTLNACSFLALQVAERVLDGHRDLSQMTQAAILDFPVSVNRIRNQEKSYCVNEAYEILKKCNAICECEFEVVIPSIGPVPYSESLDVLLKELSYLRDRSDSVPFAAIYTAPPYTLLVCKTSEGRLSVVDTHPLPIVYGGSGTAAIVTPLTGDASLRALCCWLLQRTGKGKPSVVHELTIMTKIESSKATSETDVDCAVTSSEDSVDSFPPNDDQGDKGYEISQSDAEDDNIRLSSTNDSGNSNDVLMRRKYVNTELAPSMWEGCEAETVSSLPFDIDGTKLFRIECDIEEMMKVSKDGRPWGRWMSSSRKHFKGTRRIVRCKGSPMCPLVTCPFREKYGRINRVQFQKTNTILVCFTCGTPTEEVKCLATKVWEHEKGAKHLTVMHKGHHTCIAKHPAVSKEAIRKELRNNPGQNPSRIVNNKLVSIMSSDGFDWDQVEEVAEHFVDLKRIHNARDEMKRNSNPLGENFEAMGLYKQKCDEKDSCLIFKINSRALNGKPSFVFKSSVAMANMAIEMDRDGEGSLKEEFAHVDAKHDRCRAFKTVTLWTYHPVPRKIVCLAKMEVEQESTENLVTFWELLNSMLEKVSGKDGYIFNPAGFVADENHANWNSIKEVFGPDHLSRTVSCEFHYKQSIQRHARKLEIDSDRFILYATSLLEAATETEFEAASQIMSKFIANHTSLKHWFTWWFARRMHIFRAFKSPDAPASNLAEVGHSKMASVGRKYMSLLEAAREDVASAIRQDTELRLFEDGVSKGGRGINHNQRKAQQYKAGMKRAIAYAAELEGEDGIQNKIPAMYVPKQGKHRPSDRPKKGKPISIPSRGLHQINPTNCQQESEPVNDASNQQRQSDQPFRLIFFRRIINLKVCYGCGKPFSERHKKEPNDLILKHFCHRRYKDKYGKNVLSRQLQAAYFHLNLDCTRKVAPHMELTDIIFNREMEVEFSEGHKRVLRKFGLHV